MPSDGFEPGATVLQSVTNSLKAVLDTFWYITDGSSVHGLSCIMSMAVRLLKYHSANMGRGRKQPAQD